eukprot:gene31615-39055_t
MGATQSVKNTFGGNGGIGLETAKVLAINGAKVVICSRSVKSGDDAIAQIKKTHPNVDIVTMQLDLASFKSIYVFVAAYKATNKPLNLLINNAGIMACPKAFTAEGFESQFGVNHMGHFLLTTELLPLLIAGGTKESPSRVVNVSSAAHWLVAPLTGIQFDDLDAKKGYNPFQRYGGSKLANVLFTNELNRRLSDQGGRVISMSLHPGVISSTGLNQHIGVSVLFGAIGSLWARSGAFSQVLSEKGKDIPQGASTTVYCALSPDILPGEYYADCQVEREIIHEQCADPAACRKLWEVSEQMVA